MFPHIIFFMIVFVFFPELSLSIFFSIELIENLAS